MELFKGSLHYRCALPGFEETAGHPVQMRRLAQAFAENSTLALGTLALPDRWAGGSGVGGGSVGGGGMSGSSALGRAWSGSEQWEAFAATEGSVGGAAESDAAEALQQMAQLLPPALQLLSHRMLKGAAKKVTSVYDEQVDYDTDVSCNPNVPDMCEEKDAPPGSTCMYFDRNPGGNLLSFDNVAVAFVVLLQAITFDDWCTGMYALMDAFSPMVWIYFVLIVCLGGFFVVNLFLAVIFQARAHTRTHAHACTRMHTHAHACARMRTHAHACARMHAPSPSPRSSSRPRWSTRPRSRARAARRAQSLRSHPPKAPHPRARPRLPYRGADSRHRPLRRATCHAQIHSAPRSTLRRARRRRARRSSLPLLHPSALWPLRSTLQPARTPPIGHCQRQQQQHQPPPTIAQQRRCTAHRCTPHRHPHRPPLLPPPPPPAPPRPSRTRFSRPVQRRVECPQRRTLPPPPRPSAHPPPAPPALPQPPPPPPTAYKPPVVAVIPPPQVHPPPSVQAAPPPPAPAAAAPPRQEGAVVAPRPLRRLLSGRG